MIKREIPTYQGVYLILTVSSSFCLVTHSEILLSSDARIVTYVNKSAERSEHTLNDVLTTERADIAKRLKYTKDILYRLINLQNK